jgi:hypothetical protein
MHFSEFLEPYRKVQCLAFRDFFLSFKHIYCSDGDALRSATRKPFWACRKEKSGISPAGTGPHCGAQRYIEAFSALSEEPSLTDLVLATESDHLIEYGFFLSYPQCEVVNPVGALKLNG